MKFHTLLLVWLASWWCPDKEMCSALLALCEGNPLVISGSPHKGPVMQSFGGRLNKKDGLTRYGNSHVKDKTS